MGHMSELAFEQAKYGFEIDFTRAYGEVISKLEELKPGEAMKVLEHAIHMAELDLMLEQWEKEAEQAAN